jgi:hypothetical protein
MKKKSSKKKHEPVTMEQPEDVQLSMTTNDESLSTQGFDIEQEIEEIPQPTPIIPETSVVFHKVGGAKKKIKKTKPANIINEKMPKKRNKLEAIPQTDPIVLTPRKAVPFISATKDKQIDVEEDVMMKSKKKKRKRSRKLYKQHEFYLKSVVKCTLFFSIMTNKLSLFSINPSVFSQIRTQSKS